MKRFALLLLGLLVACALSGPRVWAQARPELRLRASQGIVEVGGSVQVQLTAMSSDGASPTDAVIGSVTGFRLVGRSMVPSQQVSIVNGRMSQRQGLEATWMLEAQKVGTHTLGPVTVTVGGAKVSAGTVVVQVVPPGHGPKPRRDPNDPFSDWTPFDMWKDLFPQGSASPIPDDFFQPPAMREARRPVDPRFSLPAARGATAFLHATVDKPRAVVGEQVTLDVYLYKDLEAVSLEEIRDFHEAVTPEFLKQPIGDHDHIDRVVGFGDVAGRTHAVMHLRQFALFPLKAGELAIGPMSVVLTGARGLQIARASQPLTVQVSEPPLAGRPPGYTVGDVGRFEIRAEVSPRTIERGDAVGVTVDVSGTGNLPATLSPPVRPGVEWLEPQVNEAMRADGQGRWGGKRTFTFVVRPQKVGAVELGAFTLPFWDPETRTYGVARADLGAVQVRGDATAAAAAAAQTAPADPLPGLPPPRMERGAVRATQAHLSDRPAFWGALGAPTLAYAFVAFTRGAVRRLRERRASAATSPEASGRARLTAADAAAAGTDPRACDGAAARAIEAVVAARVGLNVRGLPVDEVARALLERGVDPAAARTIERLLEACGRARFSPTADDLEAARARWSEARAALEALPRARGPAA